MKSAAIAELFTTILGITNLEDVFFALVYAICAPVVIWLICLDNADNKPSSNDENSAPDEIIIKKKNEPTSLAEMGSNIAIFIYFATHLYELNYEDEVSMEIMFTLVSGILLFLGFFYLILGLTKIFKIYDDKRIFIEKIYMSSVIIVILFS